MRIQSIVPCVASAGLLVVAGIANAAILTGGVSFNPITDVFTYSYTLNNTSGPATVTELSILIDSALQDFTLAPTAHTDPAGTSFDIAVSGSSALPPLNEFGTFWQWQVSVPVGTTLSGFSFTTPQAPVLNSSNNYFLFSTTFTGGPPGNTGIIEFDHVIAPDFAVPELGTCGLIASALTLLASFRKFRIT